MTRSVFQIIVGNGFHKLVHGRHGILDNILAGAPGSTLVFHETEDRLRDLPARQQFKTSLPGNAEPHDQIQQDRQKR